MKTWIVVLLATTTGAARAQNSREFAVDLGGATAIRVKATLSREGKADQFAASATNDTNGTIQSVRLCVVADTPKKIPCLFTLWNTEPWEPGRELSWNLSSSVELPDLWFDVRLDQPTPVEPVSPPPQPKLALASGHFNLASIRKIYIDKMPNDLDQYIRAEITKQMNGAVIVVLKEGAADAILTGISEESNSTAAIVTGRYLGLHDNATGSVSLLDRNRSEVLWASEAGDRSLWKGPLLARGGARKVADRLVHNLKKALGR